MTPMERCHPNHQKTKPTIPDTSWTGKTLSQHWPATCRLPTNQTPDTPSAPAELPRQTLTIVYERKGRKGKPATIVTGFDWPDPDVAQLLSKLQSRPYHRRVGTRGRDAPAGRLPHTPCAASARHGPHRERGLKLPMAAHPSTSHYHRPSSFITPDASCSLFTRPRQARARHTP